MSVQDFIDRLTALAAIAPSSWHKRNPPFALSDAEIRMKDGLLAFATFGDAEREAIREQLVPVMAYTLNTFSFQLCSLALNSKSEKDVLAAAFGLVIDKSFLDSRDVLVNLALVYDAGKRINAPVAKFLEQAAQFAVPLRAALILRSFLQGPDYVKSIKAMECEVRETKYGSIYCGVGYVDFDEP